MEKMMGVMLDCSRNAVMNIDAVKKYADIIKKMGYNTLMLYTEDTYEVNNQPYFGHLRGRYSKEELKELDAYCLSIGVELIPCIQTLAHLESMFKWGNQYSEINDCDNILLAEDEKTYKFIEDMISTVAECFSSKQIHIGMDEAYRVGTGKYQRIHGIQDRFEIINRHLHRVCDITSKYGLEPMIWSDMFCRLALDTESQYDSEADASKILEKAQLPENISLVYWDYYSTDYDHYVQQIKTNKLFGRKVYFAGGAWTWKGLAPDNAYSIHATEAAVRACNDCGVDGMFFTEWGDDGSECSHFTVLPSLMYAAQAAKGNTDMDKIKEEFKNVTGCDFDTFMLLDKLDTPGGKHENEALVHTNNPSKYLLYNDLFLGVNDFLCSEKDNKYYEQLARQIHDAPGKGNFEYLFDGFEKLADVLAIKSALSLKIKEAYLKRDIDKIKEAVASCDEVIKRLKDFHKVYQTEWFVENKPHGFDVQDIRLGGLMQRIESCKQRLIQFANGEITQIPELDEPTLTDINGCTWSRFVTVNNL